MTQVFNPLLKYGFQDTGGGGSIPNFTVFSPANIFIPIILETIDKMKTIIINDSNANEYLTSEEGATLLYIRESCMVVNNLQPPEGVSIYVVPLTLDLVMVYTPVANCVIGHGINLDKTALNIIGGGNFLGTIPFTV